jgi:hypothetical protein
MRTFRFYLLAIFFLSGGLFNACKEPFDPLVDVEMPLMVVDGLITTEKKSHEIRIFYSQGYNDAEMPTPVFNASVHVHDQEGSFIHLTEISPGRYFTPSNFAAEVGKQYVLEVQTQDGLFLRSRPQEVLPPASVDSIHGNFSTFPYLEQRVDGSYFIQTYLGADSYINIHNTGDDPKVRYQPQVLLLYGYYVPDEPSVPIFVYAWRKYGAPGLPSVSHTGLQAGQSALKNHFLMFVPESPRYYRLAEEEFITGKYIIIRQYRVNDDAHAFHKARAKQLSADGSLFDPIASQLPTNVFSVNDADVKILGLFEVSAYSSQTFRFLAIPELDEIRFTPFSDLDYLPNTGALYDDRPYFW